MKIFTGNIYFTCLGLVWPMFLILNVISALEGTL